MTISKGNMGKGIGNIINMVLIKMIFHKAGITDLFTTKEITIEESVKKLTKLPLHHNPEERIIGILMNQT